MAILLRVPEVAAGATEALLAQWLVAENTPFRAGDPLALIETDKAVVEIEAEADAVLLRRLAEGGTTVQVGAPMALLGAPSDTAADVGRLLAELGIDHPGPSEPGPAGNGAVPPSEPGPAGSGGASSAAPDRGSASAPESVPGPGSSPGPGAAQGDVSAPVPAAAGSVPRDGSGRIFATPLVRRLLAGSGIALESITGTGPNGRIVRRDAERALAAAAEAAASAGGAPPAADPAPPAAPTPTPAPAPAPAPAVPVPAGPVGGGAVDPELVPHSRIRRAIASRLTASKQTVPHFYLRRTATLDALLDLRARLNEVAPHRVSVNDLLIKAVAVAYQQVPEANVVWTEDGMRRFGTIDVGVAIAAERGLVTPVVRDVGRSSPGTVAAAVRGFADAADSGRLAQRDLEGGTITVSNLGMHGVEEFSAIINPPQSAILAVGAGRQEPVVEDGEVRVRTRMTLVLSADHRAVDGLLAARWMAALVAAVEEPLRLLA
ncbi:dihydrolipoamide acetyltransferase family protein [Streptomyces doudnae]|uniref:Dihydrolipoamide acetyltransferase component of pyruvate dehydrogenase complex n=2 Tax=Streptomyces TaxID=1883 RepID=A0ABD5EM45_9ACTN|nr:dihydrolipoamide acetyltransferase family protein [Streptomyces sp. DSM 41981]MDT0435716.1 dihydrolipoamide acetyltransferase family protein [Streptomyces sp. DSM 41981]